MSETPTPQQSRPAQAPRAEAPTPPPTPEAPQAETPPLAPPAPEPASGETIAAVNAVLDRGDPTPGVDEALEAVAEESGDSINETPAANTEPQTQNTAPSKDGSTTPATETAGKRFFMDRVRNGLSGTANRITNQVGRELNNYVGRTPQGENHPPAPEPPVTTGAETGAEATTPENATPTPEATTTEAPQTTQETPTLTEETSANTANQTEDPKPNPDGTYDAEIISEETFTKTKEPPQPINAENTKVVDSPPAETTHGTKASNPTTQPPRQRTQQPNRPTPAAPKSAASSNSGNKNDGAKASTETTATPTEGTMPKDPVTSDGDEPKASTETNTPPEPAAEKTDPTKEGMPADPFTKAETKAAALKAKEDIAAEAAKAPSATEKFDKLYNLTPEEKATRDAQLDAKKKSGEWDGNDEVRQMTQAEIAARERVVAKRKTDIEQMVKDGLEGGKTYEQINQELTDKYLLSDKLSDAERANNQAFLNEVRDATKNMPPAEYNQLLQEISADPDTASLIVTVQETRRKYEDQIKGDIVQFAKDAEQAANAEQDLQERSKLLLALKILLAIFGIVGSAALETAKATVKAEM